MLPSLPFVWAIIDILRSESFHLHLVLDWTGGPKQFSVLVHLPHKVQKCGKISQTLLEAVVEMCTHLSTKLYRETITIVY